MNYLLRCSCCWATAWVSGIEEWDTNALELDLDDVEWGDPAAGTGECDHEDFEVVDSEFETPLGD